MRRYLIGAAVAALALLFTSGGTHGCDVPVFRWALENWGARSPKECYQATLFHKGPMDGAQEKAAELLAKKAWPESFRTNLFLRKVDLDGEVTEADRALWEAQEEATLPWIVLRFPPFTRIEGVLWAGPLTETSVKRIVDSPLRRRVVKRIVEGDAATWIFVESGDAEKDAAASKRLETRLDELEKLVVLPRPMAMWSLVDEEAEEPVEEHPSFSIERVSRGDKEEMVVLRILLGSEPDLGEYASQPMAFPVFGRGRVLYALVGEGISPDNVDEACMYVVGRCSCEFKWLNPGMDLLISADWEKAVAPGPAMDPSQVLQLVAPPGVGEEPQEEEEEPLPSPASVAGEEPEEKPTEALVTAALEEDEAEPSPKVRKAPTGPGPAAAESEDDRGRGKILRNVAIALGALVLVVAAAAFGLRRRLRER